MAKSQQCWFLVHCSCFLQPPCGWLNPRYSWLKLPIGFSSCVFFVKLPCIFVKCRIIRDCLDGATKIANVPLKKDIKNIWWKKLRWLAISIGEPKYIKQMDVFGYPVASQLIRWPVWKLSDCFDHKSGVQKNNINYNHNFVMIQCTNHTELANIGFCLDDLDGNLATELDIVTKWTWTITMTYFELCLVIMNHLQLRMFWWNLRFRCLNQLFHCFTTQPCCCSSPAI